MKEAYEMKMEGGHMDVEGALHEIYGKYQNMSEGNMEPMYQEISELMMYDEDKPDPKEYYSFEEEDYMPSEEELEYSRKSLSGEEDSYDPFSEFFADNPEEKGIDEEYLYEDDDVCMECGKSGMYESVKRKLNILKKKNRNRF
jgi:NAD(P)H-flavin reductase